MTKEQATNLTVEIALLMGRYGFALWDDQIREIGEAHVHALDEAIKGLVR